MMEGKLYKSKDWLHEHYIVLQESTYDMAQKANCGYATISRWLHKFGIPTRSIFEANRNYLTISRELLDLLEGELLGDGYIEMMGSRSARYTHSSKYREYLIWLSGELAALGLEQVGKIRRYRDKKYNTFSYNYTSRSYPELVPLRQQFYPNGKKIVPRSLILTPIMARQWFIGDGGLRNQAKARPDINFSTHAFDKTSIDYLLGKLRDRGFKVSHRFASNKIGMSVESVIDFLDWIGPCPIDCYSFKWNYQDNRKGTHKAIPDAQATLRLRNQEVVDARR